MTVTKSTRTISSGWTATSFMDDFLKQVFIDAGWMIDWHDSFSVSGQQARVIEIDYGPTNNFGKVYYLWTCDGSSYLTLRFYGEWDSTGNVPSGQQYYDYYNTTTTVTTYQMRFAYANPGLSYSANIYTSGIDPLFSVIEINNFSGNIPTCMFMVLPGMEIPAWVDLDKVHINGLFGLHFTTSGYASAIYSTSLNRTRRSALGGDALAGSISGDHYQNLDIYQFAYQSNAAVSGQGGSNSTGNGKFIIPSYLASNNSAFTTDKSYIITGLPVCNLLTSPWPSDFGFWAPYGSQTYSNGDILQIDEGLNEWTVVSGYRQSFADRASIYLLARTV